MKNNMPNKGVLAVITARSGSKRVPGKNLRKLGNQTLLERTIGASLLSKCVSRSVLSSDCPEIIEAALSYGCEVPFMRPAELATDGARSEDVLEHSIYNLPLYEWVLLLQPTSPFRTSNDIDLAFKILEQTKRNSCVGVKKLGATSEINNQHLFHGDVVEINSKKQRCFCKNHRMTYVLNGAVYILRTSHFLRTKKIVDVDTIGMEMNRKASLDIDTFGDLETASKLMEAQDEIR